MCAGARQRSQIGASRRNTGCHEPPSATSLICAAHRAAGRLSRSACVRVRPTRYWLHRWCELPRHCSVQLLQPVEQWLLGVFRHLSLPLHLSRPAHQSLSGKPGRLSDSPGVCLAWHAVSCTMLTAVRAGALPTGGLGSVWVVMDRSRRHRLELSALPLYRTSLPPRLTCVFASTR